MKLVVVLFFKLLTNITFLNSELIGIKIHESVKIIKKDTDPDYIVG